MQKCARDLSRNIGHIDGGGGGEDHGTLYNIIGKPHTSLCSFASNQANDTLFIAARLIFSL